jgi:hypothetical protein
MTNTERQAVLNFKITGAETVGEIKGHLKDLKKVLDDTTVGSEEYKKSIKGIADSQKVLTGVMNDTKGAVEHAKGSYYDLNQQLVEARRAYKELSEEERNSAQGTEMLDKIAKLDGELKGLDATMGQYQRNVGHYQLALESLTKQYANQKQELAAMKSAMDNLDPSTREYQQAFERAAEITHNLADRQEILKYSSKDLGDQLSNIRGIASNMAAGFSAAQAAIGLFGGESKEVEKAMLKVQQAMALVQGLQGLDGLIKRTKGLSNALGVAKTATNAQTVALNGETVATEGATVAQKGLNAAMKANPIGVVIIALQALITAWALFKDKIIEAIGGQERLNSIMNNTMPVLAGVGNAILQFVITPVKQFLVSIKGVAVVVDDIIHGKFKQAWKDAGEYAKKWADTTVNGFNVVANYQKGYSQQVIKITEAETKKKQEEYDKDKENYIKDQEAKYGSDWKWSEEGKKAYEEMYKNRLAMYKKDSEEYRQAQRDMWAYTREYNDRKNKVVTSSVTVTTKANKKIREDSKETAEEIVKDYLDIVKDYSSKVETEAKATADALALAFQNEEFKKGIEYPMTALQYAASELGVWLDTFEKERNEITKVLAEMKEAGLEGTEDYKALQTKLSEIANEESQKRMEYALREAEIYKKTYEMQLDDVERFYKNQERVATNAYNSENFGGDTSNKYYNKSIRNLLSGLMPEQERAMLEEMHKIQMEALEQRRSILEEMANDTSLSHDMRVEAEQNLADTIAEIEDKELEHTIEMNQQRIDSWKFYVDMATEATEAIGDLFGNMADFYEADIEAKVKAGKISEGEADRQFENVKKMRIAEAVINTLAGSIGAFLQATATYPPPFGEIIGGVSAAAVAAAGAAQIAKIKSSSRSGSSSVGGEGVMYATASAPQSDYNPQGITNITSGQETQDLRNALMGTNIVVSVTDINDAQKKVAVRDRESTW